jgi:hypothetical protein
MRASLEPEAKAKRLRRKAGALALVCIPMLLSARPAGAQTLPKPTPHLITTASPSVPVGAQIFGNANLLATSNPSGTIVFRLYEPGDTTCATEIFSSVVAVTGTSVNSARYTTTQAGTYRWTSTYSGDATYNAAGPTPCSGGSESVVVDKARTVLTTQADPPSGGTLRDTVTLGGGYNPTGTITFALSPPSDTFCAGPPVFTSVVGVNGNGTYHSETFRPTVSGTYRWRVTYNGDANNRGVSWTGCFDPTQAVTIDVSLRASGDYDGDAKADPAAYRPATGVWYVDRSATADTAQHWGIAGDIPLPADYDGDRKTDYAAYRPSGGMWYVLTATGVVRTQHWGIPGDVPVPADYDGDGKADYAVFRPLNGTWYVLTATGVVRTRYWGTVGDIPVPGDYDADGKADYTVYRPGAGSWYVLTATGVRRSQHWGVAGDVPVPADYDADGTTDHAVYRPSTGTWYVLTASGGVLTQYWGIPGDVPVPADYDGDAKADYTVFRPGSGGWYFRLSTGRDASAQIGAGGDHPLGLPHAIWAAFFNVAR